jgi:hypothetical protein
MSPHDLASLVLASTVFLLVLSSVGAIAISHWRHRQVTLYLGDLNVKMDTIIAMYGIVANLAMQPRGGGSGDRQPEG